MAESCITVFNCHSYHFSSLTSQHFSVYSPDSRSRSSASQQQF